MGDHYEEDESLPLVPGRVLKELRAIFSITTTTQATIRSAISVIESLEAQLEAEMTRQELLAGQNEELREELAGIRGGQWSGESELQELRVQMRELRTDIERLSIKTQSVGQRLK